MRRSLVLLVALAACSRSPAREYEAPAFDRAGAQATVEAFLAATTQAERLALVPSPLVAQLRALPEPPPAVATPVAGSLALEEASRAADRVAFRATWRERRGPDLREARGWFTLVSEGGRPRILWLAPLIDDAWGAVARGQLAEARKRFAALLGENALDPTLLDRAGWAAVRQGANDEAEALFLRAAALDPRSATPQASLAAIRVYQNRLDEAEALFREALARESTVEVLSNLGEVLRRQGRIDEALATLGEAVRKDVANPAPRLYLAELHRQLGDVPACVRDVTEAWPNREKLEAFAWERLAAARAACLFLDRQLDAARGAYEELVGRAPTAKATLRLTDFLRQQGAPFLAAPTPHAP